MKASSLSLVLLLGSASAHTIFQKLYVNGVDQGELTGIRAPDYDGVRYENDNLLTSTDHYPQPITDVTSNDIICNGGQRSLCPLYTSAE